VFLKLKAAFSCKEAFHHTESLSLSSKAGISASSRQFSLLLFKILRFGCRISFLVSGGGLENFESHSLLSD
jgi:hypothetical protein